MAQSCGLWVQVSVVITVTGHPHARQARPAGPVWGTPRPGAFAQHSAPETCFSPPLTLLHFCWPQLSVTTFAKSSSMGLPSSGPRGYPSFSTGGGWLGVAFMRIHVRARMLTCTFSNTCAPQLSFWEPHNPAATATPPLPLPPQKPQVTAVPGCRADNAKPRGRLPCQAVLSIQQDVSPGG